MKNTRERTKGLQMTVSYKCLELVKVDGFKKDASFVGYIQVEEIEKIEMELNGTRILIIYSYMQKRRINSNFFKTGIFQFRKEIQVEQVYFKNER